MLWMLILLPFLIQGVYDSSKGCRIDGWEAKDNWQPIPSFMETKCKRNPMAFIDIMISWQDIFSCWERSKPYGRYSNLTWCTDFSEKTYGCVEVLMNALKPYVDSEEKYIKDFILTSHNYTMQQLCKNGEDSFKDTLKYLDQENSNHDTGKMAYNAIMKCLPKTKFVQEMTDVNTSIMDKFDFCSNLRSATTCIMHDLQLERTEHYFSSFLKTIFDSHLDWCNKNV